MHCKTRQYFTYFPFYTDIPLTIRDNMRSLPHQEIGFETCRPYFLWILNIMFFSPTNLSLSTDLMGKNYTTSTPQKNISLKGLISSLAILCPKQRTADFESQLIRNQVEYDQKVRWNISIEAEKAKTPHILGISYSPQNNYAQLFKILHNNY